jgi:hypothetical protein
MEVHPYNPNIQEIKAGGSCIQGQIGVQSETLSQKKRLAHGKVLYKYLLLGASYSFCSLNSTFHRAEAQCLRIASENASWSSVDALLALHI